MIVEIDNNSGFCFGVRRAIETLEEGLRSGEELYCVGDIVHNEREIERLKARGLKVTESSRLGELHGKSVLFRAHGEPPGSYEIVRKNGLRLTDATCPVVLKLQQRIREAYARQKETGGQVVIFGKHGHAEVIGLVGQTGGDCILIEDKGQIDQIDYERDVEIFSQTTKDRKHYQEVVEAIRERSRGKVVAHDTICRQMTERAEHLPTFVNGHDVIVFVGGAKSSNSKMLFDICQTLNERSHFVTREEEVDSSWFAGEEVGSVGITGATSTPLWLMERVKKRIEKQIGD